MCLCHLHSTLQFFHLLSYRIYTATHPPHCIETVMPLKGVFNSAPCLQSGLSAVARGRPLAAENGQAFELV